MQTRKRVTFDASGRWCYASLLRARRGASADLAGTCSWNTLGLESFYRGGREDVGTTRTADQCARVGRMW